MGPLVLAEQSGCQVRISTSSCPDERLQHFIRGTSQGQTPELVREAVGPLIGRIRGGFYGVPSDRAGPRPGSAGEVITTQPSGADLLSTQTGSCVRRKAAKALKSQPVLPCAADEGASWPAPPASERGLLCEIALDFFMGRYSSRPFKPTAAKSSAQRAVAISLCRRARIQVIVINVGAGGQHRIHNRPWW